VLLTDDKVTASPKKYNNPVPIFAINPPQAKPRGVSKPLPPVPPPTLPPPPPPNTAPPIPPHSFNIHPKTNQNQKQNVSSSINATTAGGYLQPVYSDSLKSEKSSDEIKSSESKDQNTVKPLEKNITIENLIVNNDSNKNNTEINCQNDYNKLKLENIKRNKNNISNRKNNKMSESEARKILETMVTPGNPHDKYELKDKLGSG
jgi:hypothetical protein